MVEKIWTVLEILRWTEDYFKTNKLLDPRPDAEQLLSHVLNCSRLELYLHHDKPVSQKERDDLKVMIKKRLLHEPVQYITSRCYFMGLSFYVNSDVLIPRMETEILVERAIDIAKHQNVTHIVDIGTGSGAIAISMAHYLPSQSILASDISAKAIEIAKQNAVNLEVSDRVTFQEGDLLFPWLEQISVGASYLILANLPYVREKEFASLPEEVRNYEPREALVSGEEGLAHYQRLAEQLKQINVPWTLLLEMGIDQTDLLRKMFLAGLNIANIQVIKDLTGKDRVLLAQKK